MTAPLALGTSTAFLGAGLPVLRAQEPLTPLPCPLCALLCTQRSPPGWQPPPAWHIPAELCWSCQEYPGLGTAGCGHRTCATLSMRGQVQGQRREQPAPQKPAPAPPARTGTEGAGTRGHRAMEGMERGCSSALPHIAGLAGASGSGDSTSRCPGGSRALRGERREGFGCVWERAHWERGGSEWLPPVPPLWQHKQNPSPSAEPLGHPQLPKSAFPFPVVPALGLTPSSAAFGGAGAAALPWPGLTGHSGPAETGERKGRSDVW